jgi:hypothetical protein
MMLIIVNCRFHNSALRLNAGTGGLHGFSSNPHKTVPHGFAVTQLADGDTRAS